MQNLIKELVEKTTIPVREIAILDDGSKTVSYTHLTLPTN